MLGEADTTCVEIQELVMIIEELPAEKKMQALGIIQGLAASVPERTLNDDVGRKVG